MTERKLVLALAVIAVFLAAVLFYLHRRDAVRVEVLPPQAAEVSVS